MRLKYALYPCVAFNALETTCEGKDDAMLRDDDNNFFLLVLLDERSNRFFQSALKFSPPSHDASPFCYQESPSPQGDQQQQHR